MSTYPILGGFALACTVVCLLCILGVLRWRSCSSRRGALIIGVCAIWGVGLLGLWQAPTTNPSLRAGDVPLLKTQGASIVKDIEAFKERHSRFPSSLAELPRPPDSTRYGPWQYSVSKSGGSFELSVGDYGRNGFVLYWRTKKREWFLNG